LLTTNNIIIFRILYIPLAQNFDFNPREMTKHRDSEAL